MINIWIHFIQNLMPIGYQTLLQYNFKWMCGW